MEFRKRPKKAKLVLVLAAVFICLLISCLTLNAMIRPGIQQYANVRIQAVAKDAIYDAIYDAMATAEPFVDVLTTEGKVHYIEMNNRVLGALASAVSRNIQNAVNQAGTQGIDIPMGTASGLPLLSGMGPNLHVSFRPEGASQVEFSSEFRSAGINQTLHSVHMLVRTDIAMVLPGFASIVTTTVDMTVSEHVIVGDVPGAYAGNGGSGILNLTP